MLLLLSASCVLAQGNFHLVKDLTPDPADETSLTEMKAIDGYVYFTDAEHGLMRTDGTTAGTIVIEDVAHFWYMNYTATQGGLFYRIQNWSANYYTIGKTNGQVGAGTVANHSFISVSDLTEMNGMLYFIADDGVYGKEIWKSDGVTASMVKDIGNSNSTTDPRDLKVCNGTLFFVADDGDHGAELWKTDGTEGGTVMIKDIYAGRNRGFPMNFEILNDELYFVASNGFNGQEIWKTDGTESGTVLVKDIEAGIPSSSPTTLTRVGDAIYFEAYDNVNGRALWKTQGTAETTSLVKDIHPASDFESYISNLTDVNGILYFAGNDGVHGKELWKSDGSETFLLKDLTPGSGNESQLKNLSSHDNHLFFVSNSQLWKSDGGICNTVQITSADSVSYMDWLPYVVMAGDKLFFEAVTEQTGGELFYYDYSDGGPKGVCNQEIEFADIEAKTYGDGPFALSATASSALPVTFSSSDPNIVSINGNIATIKDDGEVTITASQAGDVDYMPVSTGKTIVIQRRIITAVEPERAGKVSVYPNPVVKDLMLEGFSPNEHVLVRLYRVDGKAILAEDLSGKEDYQIDMASLIPGIYVLNITSGIRQIYERIIKK